MLRGKQETTLKHLHIQPVSPETRWKQMETEARGFKETFYSKIMFSTPN